MKPVRSIAIAVMAVGVMAVLIGCGGSSTTADPGATLSSVTVAGAAPGVGATAQFSATATFSNGATQAATQATWSSSNVAVASVSGTGLVTGVSVGEADITATYQGMTGRSHVTIASQGMATFTLSGTVTDGTSGGILPNISIQVTDGGGNSRSTVTGASGTFSIVGLSAGSATISASAVSYQTTRLTVAISADAHIDIVLPRVACTLTLTPTNFSFPASGGTASATVASQASGCAWQAKSNDAFITVTSGSAGTDAGTVAFSVAANTGAARTGTLTIAGTTVTVSQDAAPVMQIAQYDSTFKTPICNQIGSGCDSGTLLSGWGSTEANQPNTIFNSCPDGTGPGLAVVSHIRVATIDGSALAPGKTVTIDVDHLGSSADVLFVYVAPDALHPAWTLAGSSQSSFVAPFPFRVQTVLPEGTLVAVRAINVFARPLGPDLCGTGQDVDEDDLVFRVR